MREEITLYRCDPEKNQECRRRMCYLRGGKCEGTRKAECARLDSDGKPIILPGLRERWRGKADGTD